MAQEEKVKLQKLANDGSKTDIVGEFDKRQAEKMVNRRNAHWIYAEEKASKSDTKDAKK